MIGRQHELGDSSSNFSSSSSPQRTFGQVRGLWRSKVEFGDIVKGIPSGEEFFEVVLVKDLL